MSMMDNLKELETKQKIMLVAVVVLVGFIIYFGYNTFFPSSATTSTPVIPTVTQTRAPVSTTTNTTSQTTQTRGSDKIPSKTSDTASNDLSNLQVQNTPKTAAPTPEQLALLAESQQLQAQYIHLVNQYQVAQLQQKLAQADAAIAAQRLAAAKSYLAAQKLTGTSGPLPTSIFDGSTTTAAKEPVMTVMYVGRQQGAWTAMLASNGDYYQVKEGTLLPDGSVVQQITSQGVVLNKDGQNKYLVIPKTFDSPSSEKTAK